MESEQQDRDQSSSAPSPVREVVDAAIDIGLVAAEDIPVDGILDTVKDVASAATESIGDAIGSVFDSL